ncbi:MAG TPA: hypothetical protein P5136_01690 [Methanofastidiosum sp.]|nr:hypothetical protein [Methanofastidiosum sp.]
MEGKKRINWQKFKRYAKGIVIIIAFPFLVLIASYWFIGCILFGMYKNDPGIEDWFSEKMSKLGSWWKSL